MEKEKIFDELSNFDFRLEKVRENMTKRKQEYQRITKRTKRRNLMRKLCLGYFGTSLILSGSLIFKSFKLVREQPNSVKANLEKTLDDQIADFKIDQEKVSDVNKIQLGTLFEEYLGIDLSDDKVDTFNKYHELAKLKYAIDHNCLEKNKINISYAISQAKGIMTNYLFDENPDISRTENKLSFSYKDGNSYIHLDKDYIVRDECIKKAIRDYYDYQNDSISELQYNSIIDGALKMLVCDIYLKEGILSDKIELQIPDDTKVLVKYNDPSISPM